MYKFRASAAAPLFTGEDGITQKQQEELDYLLSRPNPTDNQRQKIHDILEKKNAEPELPQGAKTFIEEIVEKSIYGYNTSFSGNKSTDKGNAVEDDSIELYNAIFITDHKKVIMELSFGPYVGHPDIVSYHDYKVIDIKSPWDKKTFPKFEEDGRNTTYEWQVKLYLYMILKSTKIDNWRNGEIAYMLVNTPENLLNDWDDETLHYMDDLSFELRHTIVPVVLTDADIEKIERRGDMATKYANFYHDKLMNKNK